MAQPSAPCTVGKYWVLGLREGLKEKRKKNEKIREEGTKKGKERKKKKMRPARFRKQTDCQMYRMVVFT